MRQPEILGVSIGLGIVVDEGFSSSPELSQWARRARRLPMRFKTTLRGDSTVTNRHAEAESFDCDAGAPGEENGGWPMVCRLRAGYR